MSTGTGFGAYAICRLAYRVLCGRECAARAACIRFVAPCSIPGVTLQMCGSVAGQGGKL